MQVLLRTGLEVVRPELDGEAFRWERSIPGAACTVVLSTPKVLVHTVQFFALADMR